MTTKAILNYHHGRQRPRYLLPVTFSLLIGALILQVAMAYNDMDILVSHSGYTMSHVTILTKKYGYPFSCIASYEDGNSKTQIEIDYLRLAANVVLFAAISVGVAYFETKIARRRAFN